MAVQDQMVLNKRGKIQVGFSQHQENHREKLHYTSSNMKNTPIFHTYQIKGELHPYQERRVHSALVHLCKRYQIFIYMRSALAKTKHKPFNKGVRKILAKNLGM